MTQYCSLDSLSFWPLADEDMGEEGRRKGRKKDDHLLLRARVVVGGWQNGKGGEKIGGEARCIRGVGWGEVDPPG